MACGTYGVFAQSFSILQNMNLAVFASGGGSNFQAIADAARSGALGARVVLCVSNRADAGVLDRARDLDIPALVLNPSDFERESDYTDRLILELDARGVDFVALAGYMRMIPPAVVARFSGRMLNIHPALLPAYGGKGMYGMRVHRAVLDSGDRVSGATVHIVDEHYDTGPIVLQETVPVCEGDTVESLAGRVLEVEHRIYPAALALFAEHRIQLRGREVTVLPAADPQNQSV